MAKLPSSERYALVLLCLCVFLLIFGETMQPAPRTQIYETIICNTLLPSADKDLERCKAAVVQEELVFLKGTERLLGALPSWLSPTFNIRLVLVAVCFEIIGGGFGVVTTMVHVIAADIATGDARTSLFAIHAIGTIAAILGQLTSSLLMPLNVWLPWLAGLCCILLAGTVSLFIQDRHQENAPEATGAERQPLLIPETDTHGPASDFATTADGDSLDDVASRGSKLHNACELVKKGAQLAGGQSRLIFLLALVLLCQISEDSLPIMLLLFASKRFDWSFAKANLFWALGEGVQLVVLLALLPLLGRLLKRRLGLDGFAKDVTLARSSALLLGLGTLSIGFGWNVPVFVIGIVLTASAAGMQSLLRSLVTDSIEASSLSLVYSIITVLHFVGGALAGPLYSVRGNIILFPSPKVLFKK
ncbi:major facilitator superfamily transporter [Diaporthe helianthi]|uniref:Major facilitator superfamily transporter n=1 Tax=Diaporthe helianthi TaxID=158607 RepID=A0A2P5HUF9_DIAHE|nr:major facilitator superfamily transporter [Diaporthe helianthi]